MSLLLDALRRAENARDRQRGVTPARPEPPRAATLPPKAPPRPSPLAALALAGAIFLAVVTAWHEQPWRPPPKVKLENTPLRLEHELKLKRPPPAPAEPPGTPRS